MFLSTVALPSAKIAIVDTLAVTDTLTLDLIQPTSGDILLFAVVLLETLATSVALVAVTFSGELFIIPHASSGTITSEQTLFLYTWIVDC